MARKTKYMPEYARIAKIACQNFGATDVQLAQLLNVSTATFYTWQEAHPEFLEAVKLGKDRFDDATVKQSILACACGFYVQVEEAHDGKIFRLWKYHPPQYKQQALWMHNRRGWSFPSTRPPAAPDEDTVETTDLPPGLRALDLDWKAIGDRLLEQRHGQRLGGLPNVGDLSKEN